MSGFDDSVRRVIAEQHDEIAALKRENAKLRELVCETLMDVGDYAEKYGIEYSYDAVDAHLDERLRALGIETS